MKQKVHSVSYLAKAEFKFTDGVYDLVALPSGAEVINVFLEVVGSPMAGNISVGFKDETDKNYFLTLQDIKEDSRGVSLRNYTATSNKVVVAEVKAAEGSAKCVLKVVYFLPSVIEVEY
ncbi:hypothetical protein KVE36_03655 [Helicobacter pylori]|nr:hypothetical protein KVE36_03655 [Helicobacter pylori]